jgi:quinoprotein relay system zinc metallohydrolase 2
LSWTAVFVTPLSAAPLAVQEVAPGVYVHRGRHEEMNRDNQAGIANIGFIVGEQAVAVIDSGGSARQGARLREAVTAVTDLPVRYVINTHMHPDHVFGNAAFEGDSPSFVGHAKLVRALAARGEHYLRFLDETLGEDVAGSEVVFPTITVDQSLELDLGNRLLRVTAHPTAHTDNDLTLYDVKTRTLWLGDLLFTERLPVIDGSLKGWLAVMRSLRAVEADRAIPGHGAVSAWPDALDDQENYLLSLLREIRRLIKDGATMEEAIEQLGELQRPNWLLFEENHPRNVVTAFTELEWE